MKMFLLRNLIPRIVTLLVAFAIWAIINLIVSEKPQDRTPGNVPGGGSTSIPRPALNLAFNAKVC